MAHYSRRDFLKTGLAAAALAGAGSLPLRAARETATDWVTLGKSDVKVTRLAFGTGTWAGRCSAIWGKTNLQSWSATPTTAAFASLKPLSLTARCTGCSAWRWRAFRAIAIG